jgi:hypothetical protein
MVLTTEVILVSKIKWKIQEISNSEVLSNFYYSVLLQLIYFIIIVNFLLCLINKLNFYHMHV